MEDEVAARLAGIDDDYKRRQLEKKQCPPHDWYMVASGAAKCRNCPAEQCDCGSMVPGAPRTEKRPSKDKNFLDLADVVAQRSNCSRRHFGAVVVLDGAVVSTGYNGTPFGVTNCIDGGCPRCADAEAGKVKPNEGYDRCICVHGEANALLLAARRDGGCKGASLYTQANPCQYCLKEIIQAGIIEVVYRQAWKYEDPNIQKAYDILVNESGIKMRLSEE